MFLIPNPPVSLITSLRRMGFSQLLSNIRALASLGLALTARVLGCWVENLKLSCSFLTTLLNFGVLNKTVKGVCTLWRQFVGQFMFTNQNKEGPSSALLREESRERCIYRIQQRILQRHSDTVYCVWDTKALEINDKRYTSIFPKI